MHISWDGYGQQVRPCAVLARAITRQAAFIIVAVIQAPDLIGSV
jgi:hypothetical protein